MTEHNIEIGSNDVVVIDKLFGPTTMCDIRITANTDNCKWVIEREKFIKDKQGNYIELVWEKVAEINAQESIFGEGD